MRTPVIAGIALLAIGVVGFVLGGVSIPTDRDTAEIGPMEISVTHEERIPLSPILSGVSILAGAILVGAGARKS
ncbi:MAG: DUF3185 domain-containing protein [Gemmatimonadetes bacterium]|nr:DUF3185 domain-containing protein [Gemmatimonadota bacterium]